MAKMTAQELIDAIKEMTGRRQQSHPQWASLTQPLPFFYLLIE